MFSIFILICFQGCLLQNLLWEWVKIQTFFVSNYNLPTCSPFPHTTNLQQKTSRLRLGSQKIWKISINESKLSWFCGNRRNCSIYMASNYSPFVTMFSKIVCCRSECGCMWERDTHYYFWRKRRNALNIYL